MLSFSPGFSEKRHVDLSISAQLRAHWVSGTLSRWQTLQSLRKPRTVGQKLHDAVTSEPAKANPHTPDIMDAFLDVNKQFEYIHAWTVFGGLWFEEIEPLDNK
jgi:hypothetical protein